ncbi:hypothetical protein [[Eubacterium] cellulosolvens]
MVKFYTDLSTGTAAPLHKCCGMLRIAGNPSAAVQSRNGLFLNYYANNLYYHDHHQMMVEFHYLSQNMI